MNCGTLCLSASRPAEYVKVHSGKMELCDPQPPPLPPHVSPVSPMSEILHHSLLQWSQYFFQRICFKTVFHHQYLCFYLLSNVCHYNLENNALHRLPASVNLWCVLPGSHLRLTFSLHTCDLFFPLASTCVGVQWVHDNAVMPSSYASRPRWLATVYKENQTPPMCMKQYTTRVHKFGAVRWLCVGAGKIHCWEWLCAMMELSELTNYEWCQNATQNYGWWQSVAPLPAVQALPFFLPKTSALVFKLWCVVGVHYRFCRKRSWEDVEFNKSIWV